MQLLHMAIEGDVEIAISEPILKEIVRVLREKFGWQPYDLHEVQPTLRKFTKLVDPKQALAVVADDRTIAFLNAPPRRDRNTSSPKITGCFGSSNMAVPRS
jgi:hypothetical protein